MENFLNIFTTWLEGKFLGNSLSLYFNAFLFLLLMVILIKIIRRVVIKKHEKLTKIHITLSYLSKILYIAFKSLTFPYYFLFSLYFSTFFFHINETLIKIFFYIFITIVTVYVIRTFAKILKYLAEEFIKAKEKHGEKVNSSFVQFARNILIAVLWAIGLVVILSNLGFNVTALVTGLGIGGVAVALAVQNILADIFSSVSIFLDKPFEQGDFVTTDGDAGTIKKIGVKTTRIQTLQGEELVISNKELIDKRIHNFKKLEKRRVSFSIGVTYNTSVEKLKLAEEIIRSVINRTKLAELGRVHFSKFGDFSLIFDIIYSVNTKDYNKYMDIQQEINYGIKEEFEKQGIEMAFPTQTIYLNKTE